MTYAWQVWRLCVSGWFLVFLVMALEVGPARTTVKAQSHPTGELDIGLWLLPVPTYVAPLALEYGATGWMTSSFGVAARGVLGSSLKMGQVVVENRFFVKRDFKVDVGIGWIRIFNEHADRDYNTAVIEVLVGYQWPGRFGVKAGLGGIAQADDSILFPKVLASMSF